MMLSCAGGANRQEAHAIIRKVAMDTYEKQEKGGNIDLNYIFRDPFFDNVLVGTFTYAYNIYNCILIVNRLETKLSHCARILSNSAVAVYLKRSNF